VRNAVIVMSPGRMPTRNRLATRTAFITLEIMTIADAKFEGAAQTEIKEACTKFQRFTLEASRHLAFLGGFSKWPNDSSAR
jgi:hypothetical protein